MTLAQEFNYQALVSGQMYQAMLERVASQRVEVMLGGRVIKFHRMDGINKKLRNLKVMGGAQQQGSSRL